MSEVGRGQEREREREREMRGRCEGGGERRELFTLSAGVERNVVQLRNPYTACYIYMYMLMVSLFIRCTMRCEIWAQPAELLQLVERSV